MARRYGRNQKRAHRARELALKKEVSNLTIKLNDARLTLNQERNQRFERYAARSGLYEHAVTCISKQIALELGEKLAPIANRIWRERSYQRPLKMHSHVYPLERVEYVSITIPEVRYAYTISPARTELE